MGMSTSIYGIKPADEKFDQMKAVYDACIVADIEIPAEVAKFFDYGTPDPQGVIVSLRDASKPRLTDYHESITLIHPGYPEAGFYVDVTKLPKDIKVIKFHNSW
jgi:hypothetical protein